ncbi:MAG TPA: sugar ABC transporter permease [Phycisphaerae bacterium]|nr:sugar ABC transporter permease [Phycisphaerae bacterium]
MIARIGRLHRFRLAPGVWFAMPWFVGLFGLTLLPMIASILLSFVEWDGVSFDRIRWVGLDHYRQMFAFEPGEPVPTDPFPSLWARLGCRPHDPRFIKALYNSVIYSAFAVPLGLLASLLLAMLLNQKLRGIAFFRTLYYLPHVLGGVATIMIWRWIFHPDFGLLNAFLLDVYRLIDPLVSALGLGGSRGWPVPQWLYSPTMAKPSLIIMGLWGAGGAMLIFLAALQNVPEQLYEAARMDGAGRWKQFRYVTLPQISPAIFFNLVMGIIGSLQTFNQAYLMQSVSQQDSLLFYVLYLYQSAFQDYRMGYASALAWVLFVVIMALTALTLGSARWWVYYEAD